jgi:hypothetical protein
MQRSTVNHMISQLESEIGDLCKNRTAKYLEMTKKRRQAAHHGNIDQTLNKCAQESEREYKRSRSDFEEAIARKRRLLVELCIYRVDGDMQEDQEDQEDQEEQPEEEQPEEEQPEEEQPEEEQPEEEQPEEEQPEEDKNQALREYKIRKYKEHLDRALNNTRRLRPTASPPRARERPSEHLTDDQMVEKYDKIVASRRKYYNKVKSTSEYKAKQKEYKAKNKRSSS